MCLYNGTHRFCRMVSSLTDFSRTRLHLVRARVVADGTIIIRDHGKNKQNQMYYYDDLRDEIAIILYGKKKKILKVEKTNTKNITKTVR